MLDRFGPAIQTWFGQQFGAPTPVQTRGWAEIARGRHTLMLAPTGSGKTFAAFLWCLDRLARDPSPGATRVVYVSPIKALAYDIERNLRAPLAAIQALGAGRELQVDVRTGDTPARERERQRKHPGQILITTPESLYLLLAGRQRERLRTVDTVIIDEIHALAPTKRGVHLAVTLERLSHLVVSSGGPDPQRIGLSATQRPLSEVARYLGGDRPVEVVDAGERPALDLEIIVPAARMDHPGTEGRDGGGMWPLIYPRLLELILAHRTTIVFVNSRRLAERVSQQLNELAAARGAPGATHDEAAAPPVLVRAHHGSVARLQRLEIEDALKAGRLRAITATSSLELGIDMGTVDLVIQLESPGAVARGLQRIGRASHHVGGTSRGRIMPKFRGDLLEATVVARGMLDGAIEAIRVPDGALDVLAQQIVAMVGVDAWSVTELERVVRRAASYRDLSREALVGVLDMLAGRYPSDAFAELRPRLTWDRHADVLIGRKGARLLSVVSGGTIPDRGTYAVYAGTGGPRVGELDEEMVAESRKGETFILGATTWRIVEITRDRVIVTPAPGEPGKMPFWRGEGPGRPVELGRAIGAFCRELDARATADPVAAHAWLARDYRLDAQAAENLISYLAEQRAHAVVPTDRVIAIERFRDELGDHRICILTPFGGRIHAPWALVVARALERTLGYPVHPVWNDDGIALRFAEGDDHEPGDDQLVPDPDGLEDALIDELSSSTVFATHFRENAARALLLPRRRPGQRTPLWAQRLRAQQLMGVALEFPAFPITLETYREVLRDVFDVPALIDVVRRVRTGELVIESVRTDTPSPFARGLVFDYVAAFLYEGDAPVAERKAQALTLDRALLRDLVGIGELRELLDPAVLDQVEAELQLVAEDRRASTADELHDVLRRLGDRSTAELARRATLAGPALDDALRELVASGRAVEVLVAGEARWIATEDAARYRDALGVELPAGIAEALLEPHPRPFESLVARHARTHGPFVHGAVAARWGVEAARVDDALAALERRGHVVRGHLRPGGIEEERCDPEVLRQLRRRTLVRLRAQVAPVDDAAYARFLPRWHGVDAPRRGLGALRDAIARLEGAALPFSELERRILPARVIDFRPQMLDELGAAGELIWLGAGALGARDGRVILATRAHARMLAADRATDPATSEPPSELHARLLDHLTVHGASFLVALEAAGQATRDDVIAALWDLVWRGVLTNDTFAPLRGLGRPAGGRGRRTSAHAAFGGRWSLVASLGPAPDPTARAHRIATLLLDRWGVACPATARADDVAGGFSAVAEVLRVMEDEGKVRRGLFVAGLEGTQFAWPRAIDRLRATPPDDRAPRVDVLCAVDPALAYGAALPWPTLADPDAHPARRVGATAILVGGRLAVWLEARATRISLAALPDDQLALALTVGLPRVAAGDRRRELRIEVIDGVAAERSAWARRLQAAGARVDYRGLVIEAPAHGRAPARGDDGDDDDDDGE